MHLNLFLLLDLVHVVLSFNSGLLCERRLLLSKLLLSGKLEIGLDALSLLLLESFAFSGLSLTLLESSLCSEGIDFGLSIGSFLLELSESLDFSFFLFLYSLGLELSFVLLLVSGSLVGKNGLLLLFLLSSSSFLLNESLSIGLSSLLH